MLESKFFHSGKRVIEIELNAISKLALKIDRNFTTACHFLLACKGKVIIMGIGKSGHIGRKIAATFASTGTPSFFIHPTEAKHGDIGTITKEDIVIVISNSGATEEVLSIIPHIKRLEINLIAICGNKNSLLAQEANVSIDIGVTKEACPLNLAPTSSTTASLVMGDALAIALLEARGFSRKEFAFSHPAGKLGRSLLLRVKDIMHTKNGIPKVLADTTIARAVIEMTAKSLGITAVVDENDHLLGIFTDSDLRRAVDQKFDLQKTFIKMVMTEDCVTVTQNMLAAQALKIMEKKQLNCLLVVENDKLIGAVNFLDFLRSGIS